MEKTNVRTRDVAASMLIAAVVVAGLFYGREVLTPLSLAAILAFMMTPMVGFLARFSLPRPLAVMFVVGGFVLALAAASAVFSTQVLSLTAGLSSYRENLVQKASSLTVRGAQKSVIERAIDSIDALQSALKQEAKPQKLPSQQERVVVEKTQTDGFSYAWDTLRSILGPAELFFLTLVYTAVLLAEQYDIRDRLVRLAGVEHLTETTSMLTDAGERLSRFFLGQAAINGTFGCVIGIVLFAIGVPNAALWGISAALLRFIPFIGIYIAAVPPMILAAAVVPGWGLFFATAAVFIGGELLLGNALEPAIQGRQSGLSPLAIFAAASFWSVIWGPIGLLLSAPLTMVLVVLGEYVPALSFISHAFGNRPPLAIEQELYHRLLSKDAAASLETVEEAMEHTSAIEVIDTVVLPAMRLAARDEREGKIDEDSVASLKEITPVMKDFILDESADERSAQADNAADARGRRVVIVPGHGPIDALVGTLLASLVCRKTSSSCRAVDSSSGLMALSTLREQGGASAPDDLVISTVGGVSPKQLQFLAKRASIAFPQAQILICNWSHYEPAAVGGEICARNVLAFDSFARLVDVLRLPPRRAEEPKICVEPNELRPAPA